MKLVNAMALMVLVVCPMVRADSVDQLKKDMDDIWRHVDSHRKVVLANDDSCRDALGKIGGSKLLACWPGPDPDPSDSPLPRWKPQPWPVDPCPPRPLPWPDTPYAA